MMEKVKFYHGKIHPSNMYLNREGLNFHFADPVGGDSSSKGYQMDDLPFRPYYSMSKEFMLTLAAE
jgi:hypothetical protein